MKLKIEQIDYTVKQSMLLGYLVTNEPRYFSIEKEDLNEIYVYLR
jgi:hypothetical protein